MSNSLLSQSTGRLLHCRHTQSCYLFLIFQKVRWKKFDESTGVPSLSKKTIEKVVSKFPSFPEQQAIGSYFSNIDNLIASHQEKISQLETLKKKLLQDMFI